jgi:hypothetical protein
MKIKKINIYNMEYFTYIMFTQNATSKGIYNYKGVLQGKR